MVRSLRFAVLALVGVALSLTTSGCFNVDKPSCSYVCADVEPRCPDSYECRADGYCHLTGTTDVCLFSDAAMPADMSVAVSTPADMTPATSSD
jgi:hypothetical protein